MEFDGQKARVRATAFANRRASSLYKSAERRGLPRKGEIGWNFVFHKALERLVGGSRLEGLEQEILEYAAAPYHNDAPTFSRMGWIGTLKGRVLPKGGKW
jgi:hypothetical protein